MQYRWVYIALILGLLITLLIWIFPEQLESLMIPAFPLWAIIWSMFNEYPPDIFKFMGLWIPYTIIIFVTIKLIGIVGKALRQRGR